VHKEVQMTYARKLQVSLQDTPYYHVIGRCVRRAWLWGVDECVGRDYSHRKIWVEDRLRQLTAAFAIDVCAYAIMSNHYHLVVHVDRARAQTWNLQQVVERWQILFAVPPVVQRWMTGQAKEFEAAQAEATVLRWKARLYDLSWFMKCLNEHLARRANAEDGVLGRFWEGRFRSQALLDEAGLLTAMVYVDLNPVRACIASCPEDSEFTSIYERIQKLRAPASAQMGACTTRLRLMPFQMAGGARPSLPCEFYQYLELVEWSGRTIRDDKPGAIDVRLPPIMERLSIDPTTWRSSMCRAGNVFGRAIGRLDHLRLHAKTLGQSWIRGLRRAQRLYAA
jgi:REP element-mobilizing transposase RayT